MQVGAPAEGATPSVHIQHIDGSMLGNDANGVLASAVSILDLSLQRCQDRAWP